MSMTRTILRDILVLSAQAVAYRLAAPQEQQGLPAAPPPAFLGV